MLIVAYRGTEISLASIGKGTVTLWFYQTSCTCCDTMHIGRHPCAESILPLAVITTLIILNTIPHAYQRAFDLRCVSRSDASHVSFYLPDI